jgi:hypothetical protein
MMLYWVIVFAILTMASLGLFIFQLTSNKSLENRAIRAQEQMDRFGSAPPYYRDEAQSRGTKIFAAMEKDLKDMANLVVGGENVVFRSADEQARKLLREINATTPKVNESDALLTALATLHELYLAADQRAGDQTQRVADLQAEVRSLTEQLRGARSEFETEVASLGQRVGSVEDEKATALAQKNEQLQGLQETLDARERELQRLKREGSVVVREKDVEIIRLETQIAMLQRQIQDLKPSTFEPNAILTKADGRILRAVPGSDVVYIDLGEADGLRLGTRFEVYSQTREARKELLGKTAVEVVTLMDGTAECRVVRPPSRPIIEGDVIVNIAYERDRKPRFLIEGTFDLDYDGQPDPEGGVDLVANLIRQWGGEVVAELDESVDFVVLGISPEHWVYGDNVLISDVVREQIRLRETQGERFSDTVRRATAMYIPVLTQGQFLFLAGFAGSPVTAGL